VHHAQLAKEEAAGVLDIERTSVVVNRCDSAQDTISCSAALKLPVVAIIPSDARVRQALAAGQPVVCDSTSRVRRPIAELAERIAEARLDVPEISARRTGSARLAPLRSFLAPVASVLGGART
jgi:MinD-like ATPase involved in chromosome partitioning or flagellar assembly